MPWCSAVGTSDTWLGNLQLGFRPRRNSKVLLECYLHRLESDLRLCCSHLVIMFFMDQL